MAHAYYQLSNGGAIQPVAEGTNFQVNEPGVYTIWYWSVDYADNVENQREEHFWYDHQG